jgi:shikimate kinase
VVSAAQLILVGAPAAGKTSVGRLVAERLGVPFTDTDELTEQRLGLSLPEAAASLSDEEVRAVEDEVCRQALAAPGIVALSSRAVEEPALREELKPRAVLWLRVSATQLTRRLGMASLGMDTLSLLRQQVDALLRMREPWYEEVATSRLDTDRLDLAATADRVEQAWEGVR